MSVPSRGRDYELRIATYNVNSVNARRPVLLRWLSETQPDIATWIELAGSPYRL
jgi:exonuclease III